MKKKLVIKISMNDHASGFSCFGSQNLGSKALKLAGGFPGVQSVALVSDQDQIEVTGDLDAVNLTNLLRKKVGYAEIVTVSEDSKEDESEDNPSETTDVQPVIWPYPRHEIFYVKDPYPAPWW